MDDLVHALLDGPTDLAGFRREARRLVMQGITPEQVSWQLSAAPGDGQTGSLWDDDDSRGITRDQARIGGTLEQVRNGRPKEPAQELRVPRAFSALCDEVLLHRDHRRFALMYRLLWRLQQEPDLRHDPLDADMMQARQMARAVHRDIHKMRAFVRFTNVGDGRHVAWFEPEHHIVEANAPFFVRRFAQMRWAILTPDRCVEWDGHTLHVQPGADKRQAPAPDAGEQLWLTYYQHIFNPARLKLAMMAREMPRRYWHNLPEAALIRPLADEAAARSHAMLAAEPSSPSHAYKPIMIQRAHVANEHASGTGVGSGVDADSHLPSLAALSDAMQACRRCPIGAGATQAVCGEGPLAPRHMIVGEQPGDQEDLAGRPFIGPAGKLLTRAMGELDWPRESIYVTNAVKHFKYELRGKRRMHKTPGQRETEICSKWLRNEIDLVRPKALVALGATAARALLGRKVSIIEEHGQWLHEREDGIPVLITWHPSALLRMPDGERASAYARWLEDLTHARDGASAMD